jgi:hypothetical protein
LSIILPFFQTNSINLIPSYSSRFDIQRLAGIRSLSSVIISDRDETFRRLLPKFKVNSSLKTLSLFNKYINFSHLLNKQLIMKNIQSQPKQFFL